jgi:hypothetical protein
VKPPDTDPRALSYEVSSVHAEEERAARTGKLAAVGSYGSCRRRQTRGKTVRGMRAYERNETNEKPRPSPHNKFVSFVYFALSRAKGRAGLKRR